MWLKEMTYEIVIDEISKLNTPFTKVEVCLGSAGTEDSILVIKTLHNDGYQSRNIRATSYTRLMNTSVP